MTYQVIITEEVANVAVTSESYPIIIEYNATNMSANATYGNTEVAAFLASGTNSSIIDNIGNISTTGSMAAGGIMIATGNVTGGNIRTAGQVSATGNITGNYFIGNGSQLTGVVATSTYGNANVAANLAAFGSNPISTTGNVTAGYFVGNGSLLTNLTGANVSGTVANATYALTSNAATFATLATYATTANAVAGANVSGTVANATYALTSNAATYATIATYATTANAVAGANVSGTVANATYATSAGSASTATSAVTASTVTNAAQGNITSLGTLTSLSVSGNITGGNVIAPNFLATNSAGGTLKNSGGTTQASWGAGGGDNFAISVSTNINGANAQVDISPTGTGHVHIKPTGTGALEIAPTNPGSMNNMVIGNVTPAAVSATTVSASGNIDGGNLRTSGLITATGNVSGGNVIVPNAGKYLGDFSSGPTAGRTFFQTTNTGTSATTFISAIPGPGHTAGPTTTGAATGLFSTNDTGNASIFGMYSLGSEARIQSLATGTGNVNDVTFKFGGVATLAATITQGGNIVAVGNLQSTQQTVIGTANVGTTGNIVVSGKNIATDMAFVPDGGNATNAALSRIVVGTGWNGNITHNAVQNRMSVQDSFARGNTGTAVQLFASDPIVSLTGNVTNNSFRAQGIGSRVRIGGGSAGNTIQVSGGAGIVGTVAALQPNIDVGNVSPYFLGNTTVSHATLNGGFITTQSGGFVGNAYGMIPGAIASTTGNAAAVGNIVNYTGFASQLAASPYITGNLYAFYHPNVASSAQQTATGLGVAAAARTATNYYAFRNDDPVAQVQLGSLRNYHEYQYSTATSGTVNIDKNNSQVQLISPTANVTIGSFQNFVTTASNGASDINQTDTVTLIIKQGATPYSVTMPTGNAAIKYASNVSTVGTSANSVTMINITGANVGGAALYLVTVSPEFV